MFIATTTVALVLLLMATIFPQSSLAQAQQQLVFVSNMAVARAGPLLYFQGGKYRVTDTVMSASTQLAALPLNVSWSADSPPWKLLDHGNSNMDFVAVASADNQTLMTFVSQAPLLNLGKYDIQMDSWTYTTLTTPEVLYSGFRPVVDTSTGLIYIAGFTRLNIYNPAQNLWQSSIIPNNTLTQRIFGGAVYNPARRSIMYLGGYTLNNSIFEPEAYITEYSTWSQSWSIYVSPE